MHWIVPPFEVQTASTTALCMNPCWKTRKSYFSATLAIGFLKIYSRAFIHHLLSALNNLHPDAHLIHKGKLGSYYDAPPRSHWPQTSVPQTFLWDGGQNNYQEVHQGRTEAPVSPQGVEEYTIYASRAFWTYLKICTCSTVRTQKRGET